MLGAGRALPLGDEDAHVVTCKIPLPGLSSIGGYASHWTGVYGFPDFLDDVLCQTAVDWKSLTAGRHPLHPAAVPSGLDWLVESDYPAALEQPSGGRMAAK